MFSRQQREALNSFIEESEVLSHRDIKLFATSLVADTLPLLSTGVRDSSLEGTVAELAVHVAILLLCGHSDVLEPLRNLAFSPATMAVSPGTGCHHRDRGRPWAPVEPVVVPRSPLCLCLT